MGIFKSSKTFYYPIESIGEIALFMEEKLKKEEYDVKSLTLITGGADISITKGNVFKAIVGMKTALKILIQPIDNRSFTVEACVGIFGQQAIPTALTMLVAWPVLIPQLWGMIQQSKLDEHVLELVQQAIDNHNSNINQNSQYCPSCGKKIAQEAKFCGECGYKL